MAQSTDLAVLTDLWWRCVADFTALLDDLDDAEWDLPTALPGWDVRAVASHVAHLESLLAGGPAETADVSEADHIRTPMAQYTEIGVVNRRERSGAEITAEIRAVSERRRAALATTPPDVDAPAPSPFGDVMGWTTLRLFQNRPVDLWTHEFDIRRATGRPGHTEAPGALHTTEQLLASVPFVLGKKVGAPTGTTVVVEVAGHQPVATEIGDDGRGHLLPTPPSAPTVRVRTDRESFLIVAGGRGQVPDERFELAGDLDLGQRFLAQLGVMP